MISKSDTSLNVAHVIAENDEHNRTLFCKYDPYTGQGSLVPREKVYIDEMEYVFIPTYLSGTDFFREIARAGSLTAFSREKGIAFDKCYDFFNEQRIHYDFEYWCATCGHIKDKVSGKIILFVLRAPQRKLVARLVDDFFRGIPIRIILLKARQWGGSTVVQLFMAWIQLFHCVNWNSCIAAHVLNQARIVRSMYSRMAKMHPRRVFPVQLRGFEGSQSSKELVGRGAVITIGSAQKPDSLRSDDIKLAHCTEVGLWRDTPLLKAADIIQSIIGSVPDDPRTCVVLESTAKGVGNYFHSTWTDAVNRRNGYTAIFVSWFEIEIYYRPFADEKEKIEFVRSMDEDEIYYFNLGATLEGLNWYRRKLSTMPSRWRMKCEFPSTPVEAFATTGRNVHNPVDVQRMIEETSEPLFRGELLADASYGPGAIDASLRFVPSDSGTLWIWVMPDKTRHIKRRYVVSMDIGGKGDDADWTVIRVIDRYMLLYGGDEECVATYRFHMDQDLAIWKAVQLARFYDNALFVPEFNSLKKSKPEDSDFFYTILDEIVGIYDNIYSRDDPTKIREGLPPRYGFHTNKATKEDLVAQMCRRIRDRLYVEHDKRALDEALTYEMKSDGTYGNVDSSDFHDDIYMATAIGLKVSSVMDPPYEVVGHEKPRLSQDGVRSLAQF